MKVDIPSPVWEDLRGILEQIAPNNPQAALNVVEAARRAFTLIGKHPGIGRLRSFSLPGIRSWPIKEYPNYLIVYLPRPHSVQIIGVLHGSMNLEEFIEARL
jgi:plasmid stabilization system protein ParE